jgi:hypothetical protein
MTAKAKTRKPRKSPSSPPVRDNSADLERVSDLIRRGFNSPGQIGAMLGLTDSEVVGHIQNMRLADAARGASCLGSGIAQARGFTVASWDLVLRESWTQYSQTADPRIANGFLQTIISATKARQLALGVTQRSVDRQSANVENSPGRMKYLESVEGHKHLDAIGSAIIDFARAKRDRQKTG